MRAGNELASGSSKWPVDDSSAEFVRPVSVDMTSERLADLRAKPTGQREESANTSWTAVVNSCVGRDALLRVARTKMASSSRLPLFVLHAFVF